MTPCLLPSLAQSSTSKTFLGISDSLMSFLFAVIIASTVRFSSIEILLLM